MVRRPARETLRRLVRRDWTDYLAGRADSSREAKR